MPIKLTSPKIYTTYTAGFKIVAGEKCTGICIKAWCVQTKLTTQTDCIQITGTIYITTHSTILSTSNSDRIFFTCFSFEKNTNLHKKTKWLKH